MEEVEQGRVRVTIDLDYWDNEALIKAINEAELSKLYSREFMDKLDRERLEVMRKDIAKQTKASFGKVDIDDGGFHNA
jgi:hypothetical protein